MKFHIFATAQLSTVQPHQNIFKVRLPVKMASKSREIQTDFWKTHPYLLFAGYYTKTSVSNEIPMEEGGVFQGGVFQENKLPPKIGVEISFVK